MGLFHRATRAQSKLRMALIGPSGSGKTYSALCIAAGLGQTIAVLDTEHGSASKYAGSEPGEFSFDVVELARYSPADYIEVIQTADEAGYDVLIIDSLSHAWEGRGGVQDLANQGAKLSSGNTWAGWRLATPAHNALIDAILQSRCHIIATIRTKTDWVTETDAQTGKSRPRKIGLAPRQREGMDYEFDLVGDLDIDHQMTISKTRFRALDKEVFDRPSEKLGRRLAAWLSDGTPLAAPIYQLAPEIRERLNDKLDEANRAGLFPNGLEAVIRQSCINRGVSSLDHLTGEQASQIITKLDDMIDSATFDPLPDPQTVEPSESHPGLVDATPEEIEAHRIAMQAEADPRPAVCVDERADAECGYPNCTPTDPAGCPLFRTEAESVVEDDPTLPPAIRPESARSRARSKKTEKAATEAAVS